MTAINSASKSAQIASPGQLKGDTFKRRLLLTIVPAVLVPLTIASVIGTVVTQRRSSEQNLNLLKEASELTGGTVTNFLEQEFAVPDSIAANPLIVEALREGARIAEAENLSQLPVEVVEERFKDTKLLSPDATLNTYLANSRDAGKFAEVFITERNGFNVAYSNETSDFFQADEKWWKDAKQLGKAIEDEVVFDDSANAYVIALAEEIKDPQTGEFLGAMKLALTLEPLQELVRDYALLASGDRESGLKNVSSVQVLDTEGLPIVTVDRQTTASGDEVANASSGTERNLEVVGGKTISQVGNYLGDLRDRPDTTAEQVRQDIEAMGVKILGMSLSPEHRQLTVDYKGQIFSLSSVEGTRWAAVAAIDKSEISALAKELDIIFLGVGLLLSALGVGVALYVSRQLSRPLASLTDVAQMVAQGHLDARAEAAGTVEIRALASSFNNQVERVQELLNTQAEQAERESWFTAVSQARTREEIEAPLNRIMAEIRAELKADRVVTYRFGIDMGGYIAAEDVLEGWTKALGSTVFDACIPQKLLDEYCEGRVVPTENVYQAGFHPEHEKLMHRLEIKSNLVVPITSGGQLLGLLVAHHCQDFHSWEQAEIDYLKQMAERVGTAIAGWALLEQQAAAAEEQRRQREQLEESVVALMSEIEGAADGDLTVRANLMAGDMGVVADLFNAVIENLQETAQQVKASAGQVSNSLGSNEGAIRELADKAISEASEIRNTLGSIEAMNQSILNVADNANQAAAIANDAFATARDGNSVMEQTVQGVLNLRGTIGETAKKMKRLGESAQKISQVVSLIDEIALKTNLLAINASLEANRAGEMGQGFTAVAQQVGSLAEQSAAAAKEIARSIADIQVETQEAIAAMEQGTAEVVDNTRLVETTKDRLADVLNKSQEIDSLMRSISNATNSQAETSQVVATLMQQVTEASEARSMSSRQVAEAMQSTAAVAQSLQSSVEQFKVESV